MIKEKIWVQTLVPRLSKALFKFNTSKSKFCVEAGKKIPYACEIQRCEKDGSYAYRNASYETDLLVFEISKNDSWVPRVVVEGKLGSVTSHDALTYSSKAATHKHVYPYLRYGILIAARENYAIPGRLARHGAYFDFMVTWQKKMPTKSEWASFCRLISQEIEASRSMQTLLTTNRLAGRKKFTILHRPLILQ